MREAVKRLLLHNLGLKAEENLLVLGDTLNPSVEGDVEKGEMRRRNETTNLVPVFSQVAEEIGAKVRSLVYPALGAHGKEPPTEAWELAFGKGIMDTLEERGLLKGLLSKDLRAYQPALEVVRERVEKVVDVVVAIPHYSTSHTSFRKLITESGGRYASMPLFDPLMLTTSLAVELEELKPLTERLATLLAEAEEAVITSEDGTNLHLVLKGRTGMADTGDLRAPGSFGNLPAGEAFIAPVEGCAQGTYSTKWGPTRRLAETTKFTVRDGLLESIVGDRGLCSYLEGIFEEHPQARNVAELGIGTNPKASRPDNILEAEKILGTVHLAFGDNSTFGGRVKVPFHQDFVLFEPTLLLKGDGWEKVVIQQGEVMVQGGRQDGNPC